MKVLRSLNPSVHHDLTVETFHSYFILPFFAEIIVLKPVEVTAEKET